MVAAAERNVKKLRWRRQVAGPAGTEARHKLVVITAWRRNGFGYNLNMPDWKRITQNPDVMGGKPCIRGMRVTVGNIVNLLNAGRCAQEILHAFPYLEAEDLDAAVADAVEHGDVFRSNDDRDAV